MAMVMEAALSPDMSKGEFDPERHWVRGVVDAVEDNELVVRVCVHVPAGDGGGDGAPTGDYHGGDGGDIAHASSEGGAGVVTVVMRVLAESVNVEYEELLATGKRDLVCSTPTRCSNAPTRLSWLSWLDTMASVLSWRKVEGRMEV